MLQAQLANECLALQVFPQLSGSSKTSFKIDDLNTCFGFSNNYRVYFALIVAEHSSLSSLSPTGNLKEVETIVHFSFTPNRARLETLSIRRDNTS